MLTYKESSFSLEQTNDDGAIEIALLVEKLQEIKKEQPLGLVWINESAAGVSITVKTWGDQ